MSRVVPLDGIVIGERIRSDLGDVSNLATSIDRVGLLHPVVVDGDFNLIAGERRIAAVRSLGHDSIAVTIADDLAGAVQLLDAEKDENTCRKAFTVSEALRLSGRLARMEKPKAEERQGARTDLEPPAKLAEGSRGDVREIAAEPTGFGHTTLDKARKVHEKANDPALSDRVRKVAQREIKRMDREGKVDRALNTVEQVEMNEHLDGMRGNSLDLRRSDFGLLVAKAAVATHKRGLLVIRPDRIEIELLDDEVREQLHDNVASLRLWCDEIEELIGTPHLASVKEIHQ